MARAINPGAATSARTKDDGSGIVPAFCWTVNPQKTAWPYIVTVPLSPGFPGGAKDPRKSPARQELLGSRWGQSQKERSYFRLVGLAAPLNLRL
jgi:hypothetical protein